MIIKVSDSTIFVDKRAVVKDLKVNIAGNNQYRAKFVYISERGNEHPMDFVVRDVKVSIEKLSLVLNVRGEELVTVKPFEATFKFNIFNRKLSMIGKVGNIEINESVGNIIELLPTICNIFTQIKK